MSLAAKLATGIRFLTCAVLVVLAAMIAVQLWRHVVGEIDSPHFRDRLAFYAFLFLCYTAAMYFTTQWLSKRDANVVDGVYLHARTARNYKTLWLCSGGAFIAALMFKQLG